MPEHKKEEISVHSHHTSGKKSVLSSVRSNPWILVSIVLAIVVVVSLFSGLGINSGGVSSKVAGENLVKFINSQGQGTASVVSSVKQGELYKVTVSFNGQEIPVFVTLDGIYLITNPVALDGATDTTAGAGDTTGTTKIDPSKIPIAADTPVTGSATAKVTIVEFSDFSCPFCVAASGDDQGMIDYMKSRSPSWEPIVTNVIKDYVQTGKVRFVSFYSMGHTGGHPAQSVAWCLNDQSSALYWKFYAKAYESYDSQKQTAQDVEDLVKMTALAKTVGADATKLKTCLDSKKYDSRFDTEQALGQSLGVQGTPAFFVNGQLVSGAVPYSQVKAIIDAELAK
ncbi:MAG: DsbA family protein [archaeon]